MSGGEPDSTELAQSVADMLAIVARLETKGVALRVRSMAARKLRS